VNKSLQYRKYRIIVEHFINKKGKEFRDKQLAVSLSRINDKNSHHLFQDIIDIVEELKKIN